MSRMVRVNMKPVRGFTVMGVEDGIYPCGVSALGIGWEGSEPGPRNGYVYEIMSGIGGVDFPQPDRLDSYGEGGR